MRIVVDRDSRRKIEFLRKMEFATLHRFRQLGREIVFVELQRMRQPSLDLHNIAIIGNRLKIPRANT
jgi:hypothetical protein